MILNFRKREAAIEAQEVCIEQEKKKFHKAADDNIKKLEKINKVLGNGITLKIYQATGHHK